MAQCGSHGNLHNAFPGRARLLLDVYCCALFLVGFTSGNGEVGYFNGGGSVAGRHSSPGTEPELPSTYYNQSCPQAEFIVFSIVHEAVQHEARMAASLLRLHFHDCFVTGCDASILLDSTPEFESEKLASPNKDSVRGYNVVDEIKASLESSCPETVSCADILALAARDAVLLSGGPYWRADLGRKDSMTANRSSAEVGLPSPFAPMDEITSKFADMGLSVEDMVVLSGAHTIGQARCRAFQQRLLNNSAQTGTQMQADMLNSLRQLCNDSADDDRLSSLDMSTPVTFDSGYFKNLARGQGLLQSDQLLYSTPGITRNLTAYYLAHQQAFFDKFTEAMVKLGRLNGTSVSPDASSSTSMSSSNSQIRKNCRRINN